ncbi:hypothetical protein DFH08DRAFT_75883 [Mycena albidolilacea]|uniref:Uncharacterized protein n=1 Tax=Mycena albidolilacea TaxID=1033008 RepID=A0AAD6YZL8_9AGAR|nr:hypothetical protein DFH08DRAFT_75883 [Mycena albidolilacea]
MDGLPTLTASASRHPSSCASLSLPLLDLLDAVLPPPSEVTLSVGSGTGLLEALFLQRHPHRSSPGYFLGVEVAQARPINRFLPEANTTVVLGTWAVAPGEAERAEGLMFVYPRQPALVRAYLGRATRVRTVVWIGPRCDVDDFVGVMREWGEEDQEATGGRAVVEDGEMVMVFRSRVS